MGLLSNLPFKQCLLRLLTFVAALGQTVRSCVTLKA